MGARRVHAYRLGANQPEATFGPVFQTDRFLMVVSDLYTYRTYIVKLPIRRNCKRHHGDELDVALLAHV